MGIDMAMCDWVERNHRIEKDRQRRDRLRKANRLTSIKETVLGIIIMFLILLAGGIAGGIEMGTIQIPF